VIVTAVGGHNVKAFTGPADHSRHDEQWQYPIAAGLPATLSSTAPQKQRPLYSFSVGIDFLPEQASARLIDSQQGRVCQSFEADQRVLAMREGFKSTGRA
jgi:hypothetical protein